jgi:hypothetical protein
LVPSSNVTGNHSRQQENIIVVKQTAPIIEFPETTPAATPTPAIPSPASQTCGPSSRSGHWTIRTVSGTRNRVVAWAVEALLIPVF